MRVPIHSALPTKHRGAETLFMDAVNGFQLRWRRYVGEVFSKRVRRGSEIELEERIPAVVTNEGAEDLRKILPTLEIDAVESGDVADRFSGEPRRGEIRVAMRWIFHRS